MELELASEGHQGAHEVGGRAQGGALVLHRTQLELYIFMFGEKNNQREGFIAFYDTKPTPSPKLSQEGCSGAPDGLQISPPERD